MYIFWFEFTKPIECFYQTFIGNQAITYFDNHNFQNFQTIQNQNFRQFQEQLLKELQVNHSRYEKKMWSSQEVDLLIQKRQAGLSWRQISECIQGVNPQVCRRKYSRILAERSRWPIELDQRVKFLYQQQKREWREIFVIIGQEMNIKSKKKLSQIKERYHLHLRKEINKEGWTISQDVNLLNCLKDNGKKWRTISNIFENRTQLQVKNRFYGTLLPILKRVVKKTGMDSECLNNMYKFNDL